MYRFSQGICVCLSNYDYLLITTLIKVMVWFIVRDTHLNNKIIRVIKWFSKTSSRLDFKNQNNEIIYI